MKPFFVYLLRCGDDSFYCGHTDDLEARLRQHEEGDVGYTATRKPLALAWQGEFETREGAIEFEQRVKGWSRAKKEALVAGDWVAIQRHAWGSRNPLPEHLRLPIDGLDPSIPQGERNVGDGQSNTALPSHAKSVSHALAKTVRPAQAKTVRPAQVKTVPPAQVKTVRPEVSKAECANPTPRRADDGPGPSIPQGERMLGDGQANPLAQEDLVRSVQEEADPHAQEKSVRPEVSKAGSKDSVPKHSITRGDRRALAKAITLLESTRADHRERADALLQDLMPHTGQAMRIGISGVPGVGKSTFIEVLGLHLIAQGHRVAVLAIDPSSSISGGSILGDKTRMEHLSVHDQAFIRPSPASGTLGGVAEKTRETMLLCEAAGYDVVIVETVGVGQSETAVAGMTDLFVLLQLPNAGDDLQAIKRGVMELADMVVINKADIDAAAATRAQAQITSALRVFGQHGNPKQRATAPVMQLSALNGEGVASFWQTVLAELKARADDGRHAQRRRDQSLAWMWDVIRSRLLSDFREHAGVGALLTATSTEVAEGRMPPSVAARRLLQAFERS